MIHSPDLQRLLDKYLHVTPSSEDRSMIEIMRVGKQTNNLGFWDFQLDLVNLWQAAKVGEESSKEGTLNPRRSFTGRESDKAEERTRSDPALDVTQLADDQEIEGFKDAKRIYVAGNLPPFVIKARKSQTKKVVLLPTVLGERPDEPTSAEVVQRPWTKDHSLWTLDVNGRRRIVWHSSGAPGGGVRYRAWEVPQNNCGPRWSDTLALSPIYKSSKAHEDEGAEARPDLLKVPSAPGELPTQSPKRRFPSSRPSERSVREVRDSSGPAQQSVPAPVIDGTKKIHGTAAGVMPPLEPTHTMLSDVAKYQRTRINIRCPFKSRYLVTMLSGCMTPVELFKTVALEIGAPQDAVTSIELNLTWLPDAHRLKVADIRCTSEDSMKWVLRAVSAAECWSIGGRCTIAAKVELYDDEPTSSAS